MVDRHVSHDDRVNLVEIRRKQMGSRHVAHDDRRINIRDQWEVATCRAMIGGEYIVRLRANLDEKGPVWTVSAETDDGRYIRPPQ